MAVKKGTTLEEMDSITQGLELTFLFMNCGNNVSCCIELGFITTGEDRKSARSKLMKFASEYIAQALEDDNRGLLRSCHGDKDFEALEKLALEAERRKRSELAVGVLSRGRKIKISVPVLIAESSEACPSFSGGARRA